MDRARRLELIALLEQELDFIAQGGYSDRAGQPPQPSEAFRGGLTCINHWVIPGRDTDRCEGCVLHDFVPEEFKDRDNACRFIPLTPDGETVEELSGIDRQEALQNAIRGWLERTIEDLREGLAEEE